MRAFEPFVLLASLGIVFTWSAIGPFDRTTWVLEVAPVLLAAPLLAATRHRFPFTPLAYRLLFLHALILIVGGHYTYARVPIGGFAQELLDLDRNPFDRLGHFAQGFVPAIVAREVLLRLHVLRRGAWLFALVVCVCLAVSAVYELVEWGAALVAGEAADAFLGTQGDPWDTQWDMFLALVGAITAQLTLGRAHDAALARLRPAAPVAGPA